MVRPHFCVAETEGFPLSTSGHRLDPPPRVGLSHAHRMPVASGTTKTVSRPRPASPRGMRVSKVNQLSCRDFKEEYVFSCWEGWGWWRLSELPLSLR